LRATFAARTDLGLKRKINEDSFYAHRVLGLFMVLDGIGGHQAGEVASKLGVSTISESVRQHLKTRAPERMSEYDASLSWESNVLKESFLRANSMIYEAAHSRPEYLGMGTTAVCLLTGKKTVSIAHVGDSRIYLIRNNAIERLTTDHSLVMEQVKRGIITKEEAEKSEMRNIITRALGADEKLEPTLDELLPFEGDYFLLASDGLTDLVGDEEILEMVWKNRFNLDRCCHALIDRANERGGKDNITTILLCFETWPQTLLRKFFSLRRI
jgi:PPM family protein phosphatase